MDNKTNRRVNSEKQNNHSHEYLSSRYTYDPETGYIYSTRSNRVVGFRNSSGYTTIDLGGGTTFLAHRLGWFLHHGEWPPHTIDHINGIRDDNRLHNLRLATQQQNLQNRPIFKNNKLGVKGVCLHKGRYRAQLWRDGRFVLSKYFRTSEEAAAAYRQANIEYFGSFARLD